MLKSREANVSVSDEEELLDELLLVESDDSRVESSLLAVSLSLLDESAESRVETSLSELSDESEESSEDTVPDESDELLSDVLDDVPFKTFSYWLSNELMVLLIKRPPFRRAAKTRPGAAPKPSGSHIHIAAHTRGGDAAARGGRRRR